MVSTRGPKNRYFEKGEKVLCYEPDPTKAKVLYDSKILGIYESKDKRGRKIVQYKVHFQGWSSSWDRKVNADYVLKDTEENRQLQRDLAEKAQLFIGTYLYRRDRSATKKRTRKPTAVPNTTTATTTTVNATAAIENIKSDSVSPKRRPRGSSEDNFSSSGSTFEKHEFNEMKDDDCDTESCCSSVESFHDENRVMLRISERLRQYLEYDHDMVVKFKKRHLLPSRLPVITILECFVRQSALKMIFSTAPIETTRRRNVQRVDKKERELDKIIPIVNLLKEVADGLRIYFDFTIADYLLYKEEKEYALSYLTEESLKNFTYVSSPITLPDIFHPTKSESEPTSTTTTATSTILDNNAMETGSITDNTIIGSSGVDEPRKRTLRSCRSDDCDFLFENCLSSIASNSSGASTPLHSNVTNANINYLKTFPQLAQSLPAPAKEFLQNIFSWRLLPTNAEAAPSMIFGAPHLARLIVKLPEFLNATSINDEKLKVLLQHLDSFTNFLESHKDWFNEENYMKAAVPANRPATTTTKTTTATLTSLETTVAQSTNTITTTLNTNTNTTTKTTAAATSITKNNNKEQTKQIAALAQKQEQEYEHEQQQQQHEKEKEKVKKGKDKVIEKEQQEQRQEVKQTKQNSQKDQQTTLKMTKEKKDVVQMEHADEFEDVETEEEMEQVEEVDIESEEMEELDSTGTTVNNVSLEESTATMPTVVT